jgi:hypothetical protein
MNVYIIYRMTDNFVFEDRQEGGEQDNLIVGGMSVSAMLKNNKNILDFEGSLFTRFKNLVVPIGLQLHPMPEYNIEQDDNEEYNCIDIKKFDSLFYSVGKDLGISKSRTYKNRTMKNPIK